MQFLYYPRQTTAIVPAPYCFSTTSPVDPVGCNGELLAANIANIKRVSVQVTIQSENPNDNDENFGGGQMTTTLISNVDLRNQ